MNGIGERLKELRKKNALTQERLAESLGISYQAVSKWETGAASPDLSLIIPLAKLFHISTDELLGYTADRRADLEEQWQQALRHGVYETLKISEAALKEYPHDETFLYRRACDEYFCAEETTDEAQKREYLECSFRHFKALIDEYPDFSNTANSWLSRVLSKLGRYEEALSHVQNLPDPTEKNSVLLYCLTGEELLKHRQKITNQATHEFIHKMIHYESYANLQTAEDIINLIFSDGNYLDYYYSLAMIHHRRAKLLVAENCYEEAVASLRKSIQYVMQYRKLKGTGNPHYTTPIFDRLVFDTSDSPSLHEHNLWQLESKEFDVLRDREDFIALTKDDRTLTPYGQAPSEQKDSMN